MKKLLFFASAFLLLECSSPETKTDNTIYVKDSHSYSQPEKAVVKHLELDFSVDFEKQILSGKAAYSIQNNNSTEIIFDTKNLNIEKITIGEKEQETKFSLSANDSIFGQALNITIEKNTSRVTIYYSTTKGAEALQWLTPQQTAGKAQPFLFTQGQAILSRTWFPCQDSPGIRFTYNAKVTVPKNLLAVMSAENPVAKNDSGLYSFKMPQPVPAYLVALSVGDIEFKKIGERTGVYAEPVMLEKSVYEFADMEDMLISAEKLYGKYQWGRYDVIVLPPSFPFGGMENPRLTFATPTIIAGDRSLTSLVAHELAHSWSGNYVTNATWDDIWMNEGFTVYFERRIVEAIYGKEYVEMQWQLGLQDLEATLEEFQESGEESSLKLHLKGRNPDDGLSDVPYEKGAHFVLLLEQKAGREKLDKFLNDYFNAHAFKTITTEDFLKYLDAEFIKKYSLDVNVDEWVYKNGLPANCPRVVSAKFKTVEQALFSWSKGTKPELLPTKDWTCHEWLHFIRNLPGNISAAEMEVLDNAFHFTNSGNSEVAAAWFVQAINSNYKSAYPEIETFLMNVGRRKFIVPLYKQFVKTEDGKKLAQEIYAKARPNYHAVAAITLDELLGYKQP